MENKYKGGIFTRNKLIFAFALLALCAAAALVVFFVTRPEGTADAEHTIYAKDLDESHVSEGELEYRGTVSTAEYVDNEVLLAAKDGVTFSQIEKLVSAHGGTIVGRIETVGRYQIELDRALTAAELNALAAQLQADPLIEDAYPNTIIDMRPDSSYQYYPSDDWNEDGDPLWNEGYPAGRNWGVEAINAPSAWKLLEQKYPSLSGLPTVTIGVIDTMFDLTHSDLKFKACWSQSLGGAPITDNTVKYAQNAANSDEYETYVHGTHVAGTIAAVTNNGFGINGVAANQPLYAASMLNSGGRSVTSVFYLESVIGAILEAEEANGCKKAVINYSMGYTDPDVSSSLWDRIWLTDFLKDYLKKGYDFVIVSAAGNDYNRPASENNVFCAITDSEVKAHIIVVGSAKKYTADGTFAFYAYNGDTAYNYGDRINVAAPGEHIYSTVPSAKYSFEASYPDETGWFDGAYRTMTGTSQAAPHVSGVAALVWAANPSLTGAEVVDIIKETADIDLYEVRGGELFQSTDFSKNYHKMVNAAKAVSVALNIEYTIRGTCGDGVEWTFDSDTGTLTISGGGYMADYDSDQLALPWHRYKNQVTKVVIQDGVKSIGAFSFAWFDRLQEVEVGGAVTSIGEGAFLSCRQLSTVSDLPEGLSSVGASAFYGVDLTELTFLGPAPTLGDPSANPPVSGDAQAGGDASFSYGKDGKTDKITLYYPIEYKDSWDPNSVEKWQGYHVWPFELIAFGNCGAQGDNVVWALYKDGHMEITGRGAMSNARVAGDYRDQVLEVEVGDGVLILGDNAFSGYTNLTDVTLPDSLLSIEGSAFLDCSSLEGITIPGSVIAIGESAFGRSGLVSVTIPGNVIEIGRNAFNTCTDLVSVTIQEGVTTIGGGAFAGCSKLPGIVIPNSVTALGGDAFNQCAELTHVSLGSGLTSIENGTFSGCYSLPNIVIPEGVSYLGMFAFDSCYSLSWIAIPTTMRTMGNYVYNSDIKHSAFASCYSLRTVYYAGSEAQWQSIWIVTDGDTYIKDAAVIYNSYGPNV